MSQVILAMVAGASFSALFVVPLDWRYVVLAGVCILAVTVVRVITGQ